MSFYNPVFRLALNLRSTLEEDIDDFERVTFALHLNIPQINGVTGWRRDP